MSDYTLDDIFEKNLLFLLPFYIFNLEHSFKHPKRDEDYMANITAAFLTIKEKLEELLSSKQINELTKLALQRLIDSVSSKVANKHDDVKKGVTSIMGGKILDYPEKTAYKSGLAQMSTALNELYSKLFAAGRIDDAKRAANEPAFRDKLLKDFGLDISDSNISLT